MKSTVLECPPETAGAAVPLLAGKTKRGILSLAAPGILLVLVCLVLFLNKAYTIDDPWFLLEARQIMKTPLQPMSFPICWMGNELCLDSAGSLGAGTAQALMGYLLIPTILAGGAEWVAHLLQIFLACIAVLAMVRLALRLGFDRTQATLAGLLLAAIPPFLSMASTAMPDIPAVALGLTGIERLLAWKDEQRWHQAVLASLMLGLAPWARPHLALLLPLGALWLFDEFQFRPAIAQLRRKAWLWAPVLIAACILAGVDLLTRDRGHQSSDILIGNGSITPNLAAYGLYLFFPIPFAAVWLAAHCRKAVLLVVLPAIPFLIAALFFAPQPSLRNLLEYWPLIFALYGLIALIHMIVRSLRARDRLGILLGLWVSIPLPAVIYAHLPIKYMTAVLPAIVLILLRLLPPLPRPRAWSAYGGIIIACATYSCLLLIADADFAEYGRRAAAELIAPRVAAGEKVWFGGQWGFYWYAQQAGAAVSKPGEAGPHAGELLAVGLAEGGGHTLNRFPHRKLIDARAYDSPHGRTMGFGGGLYSNFSGKALWVWSPQAVNVYELWRIE
jgi:hypothetical protein